MPRTARVKGTFRIARNLIGCTWSCPDDKAQTPIPNAEAILEVLVEKFGACDYTIGEELHKDGIKRHYHGWFNFANKVDTVDVKAFDVFSVHPNIIKPGKGWEAYCVKDKKFITNHYQEDPWFNALQQPDANAAMEVLWNRRPREMCMQAHNIERNVRRRLAPPSAYGEVLYEGPYPERFYPVEWDMRKYALLICGESGLNKTQFARYFLKHLCGSIEYVKGHFEACKDLTGSKAFIHDEIYLAGNATDPGISVEYTDVENGGTVLCRNTNKQMPPGVPRIFISNYEFPFKNPQGAVYGRRVQTLNLFPPGN